MSRSDFGTVRRRKSSRWQTRYCDAEGRQRSAGTFTRASAARAELRRISADLDRGTV